MSWLIEKGRSYLGFSASSSSSTGGESGGSASGDEDKQKFIRAQNAQKGQLQRKLEKIKAEIDSKTITDRNLLRLKIQERERIQQQITIIQSSLNNLEGVELTTASANANVQNAKILKSANTKIEQAVKETERLDFDGLLDDYKDNSRQTYEMSNRLAQPWDDVDPDVDERIDAEMDKILLEQKQAPSQPEVEDFYMPTVPTVVTRQRVKGKEEFVGK